MFQLLHFLKITTEIWKLKILTLKRHLLAVSVVSIGEQFLTACTDCKNVMYLKIQDFFNAIISFFIFSRISHRLRVQPHSHVFLGIFWVLTRKLKILVFLNLKKFSPLI